MEAKLAVEDRRLDDAAESRRRLQVGGQRHIAALRLALRGTAQAKGDWVEAVRVVRRLVRSRRSRPNWRNRSSAAPPGRAQTRAGDALAINTYWQDGARDEQRDPRLVASLARALIAAGDGSVPKGHRDANSRWVGTPPLLWYLTAAARRRRAQPARQGEDWQCRNPRSATAADPRPTVRAVAAVGQGRKLRQLEASLSGHRAGLGSPMSNLAHLAERINRTDDANRHYRAAGPALAR